ncbi:survival protein SurA precursor [Aquipluma nitroreducens]|uniref:Survival protein SurA n=1 Tax=Aquipluma nitroreducens TaxID=2010828 RepID=A0A5K7SD83_9BACT|nr:peptidylprolyl isomerase [Aquipluma nitroreducens]BBE19543.1 survival protein SurA precursor [Aquipluma nitroreducens]
MFRKSEVRRPEPGTQSTKTKLQPATHRSAARGLIVGAFLVLFSLNLSAQKKSETVVTIGTEKVSKEEFEANYRKNNANILDKKELKSPEEYLDLYIKFKLKILEAEKLGYDTVRSYRDELGGYRKDLAKPYLTDVSFNEEMVKTAYYRTQYERKASHLLILVTPEASPADTLAAWNKINNLRQQIIAGADFNEMAAKYSEDPSAVQNKGLLGYFTAFQMVFPFEDMTYRTPVGQVSEIVRTRFGYHLIKVHDERLAAGEIKVAHIMKMFPKQASEETIANLKLKADSIWQKATSGADFAGLAKQYSDDKQTATEGGVMNWFTPNNMVPQFAEAAFALKNDGDISPVIRTPYGWHIIKRLERKTTQPIEKLRHDLEAKIKQNPAISKHSDEAFDRKLRAEYQLKIDEPTFTKLIGSLSDTAIWKNIISDKKLQEKLLVTFADQKLSVAAFTDFLQKQKFTPRSNQAEAQLKEMLNKYINQELLAYENSQLEKKHPDFARLYQEYHDGILLFNISKDKIWDVATTDTVRLQNYFDQTTKKYYWGDRFKGWIIKANNGDTRANVESMLNESRATQKNELTDLFNTKTENNIQITDVACEKGENPIVDYFIWGGAKPSGFDETTTFVHGKIVKNEMKQLKDAWGLYSSDFQEQIEKEWVDSLLKKYPVSINQKVLKKIQAIE